MRIIRLPHRGSALLIVLNGIEIQMLNNIGPDGIAF